MMSLPHATIAAAGTFLILGTTTSTIGQICYPLSH
jgi:hypothetical protein